jgi:hypothetical protein
MAFNNVKQQGKKQDMPFQKHNTRYVRLFILIFNYQDLGCGPRIQMSHPPTRIHSNRLVRNFSGETVHYSPKLFTVVVEAAKNGIMQGLVEADPTHSKEMEATLPAAIPHLSLLLHPHHP